MLRKLEVLHYRALKYIHIRLSHFQILVGPNASGKSTFLDVLHLVKDILNETPAKAVEKRASRFEELLWQEQGDKLEIALELEIPAPIQDKLKDKEFSLVRYDISLQRDNEKGVILGGENLWLIKGPEENAELPEQSITLFPREPEPPEYVVSPRKWTPKGWRKVISKSAIGNDYFKAENSDWNITYKFGPGKSSLARMPEDERRFPVSLWVKNILTEGIQFLQLDSNSMRWSCRPDLPVLFQPDGSNLPKVIQYLQKERPDFFDRWRQHLQTALDVKDIVIQERPEDRSLYLQVLYQNGLLLPSWVISDGTLRFFAQTLIAYLPEKDHIYMIEEPENGLHPQAIESLFQSLSSVYDNQVFVATHSPVILAKPRDILCFSKSESGAVDIIRGDQHPKLRDWQKDVDLATLHAAGVLQ